MQANQIEPTAKQLEFLTSTDKFTCFSGGFGSGKTYAGCLRSLLLSQYPGNFGLIGRLTYPELRDTTRKTFFEVCPPEYYDEAHGGQWKPSENYLRLVNGSEIIFRHLDNVSEKELLSLNLGWFYIDQAEEVGEQVFRILQSRLRLNTVPNRYGFIICNPEPGNWIDNMFRKPVVENKDHPDFHFIESASTDNPYLPPDYIPTLRATYPEEMVKRFVEGRWDVMENQIYSEYDYRTHVIQPFEIPKEWERIVAVDHGMVNPTAAIWAALDYDGNVFVYDEYYSPGIVSEHAKQILNKSEGQEIGLWLIDPSTQAKTREKDGGMWSVIEEYEDYGLFFTPANNEKLAGINRVKEFLKPQQNRRHPITKEVPSPRLFIFKNCVDLIAEMPQYQWRKLRGLASRNSLEQPRDFNDHACLCPHTKVLTNKGEVSIINIKQGDKVWTPLGWSKVIRKEKTGVKKVTTFRSTKATGNHPFLTQDGSHPLKDLKETDRLWSVSIFADEHTGDIRIVQDFPMRSIFAVVGRRMESAQAHFTSMSGNSFRERLQKRFIFIIKMGILLTTVLKILNYTLIPHIKKSIGEWIRTKGLLLLGKTFRKHKKLPQHGINHQKDGHGTASTPSKCGCKKEITVYNLTTDTGMFIANGVLSSNCDALRYIIMSRFPAPLKRGTADDLILPENRRNMNLMTAPMQQQSDDELGSFYGGDKEVASLSDLTGGDDFNL